jgi:hypothetical protein
MVGGIEVTEATIALVRSRLIHPTRPELQVLASEQSRRRFEVSLVACDSGSCLHVALET